MGGVRAIGGWTLIPHTMRGNEHTEGIARDNISDNKRSMPDNIQRNERNYRHTMPG